MAKFPSSNPNDGPSSTEPRYRPNWLAALTGLLAGTWLLVAMADFDPRQTGWLLPSSTTLKVADNFMGRLGTDFARLGFVWLGVAAWLVPVFCLWSVWLAVWNARRLVATRFTSMVVAVLAGSGLAAMLPFKLSDYFSSGLGGGLGHWLYGTALEKNIGVFGAASLLLCVYGAALVFIFTKDIGVAFERLLHGLHNWRAARSQARAEARAATSAPKKAFVPAPPPAPAPAKPAPPPGGNVVPASGVFPATPVSAHPPRPPEAKAPPALKLTRHAPAPVAETPREKEPAPVPAAAVMPANKDGIAIVKPAEPKKAAKIILPQSDDANYRFPPLSLLKEQVRPAADSDEEYKRNMADLVRILGEFDVAVTPGEIHVGPVITRYELVPAAGVRVEKIAGLDKNIALGMRAQSVRILAPIPGKAAVGVEVPNLHPTPVGLREILESEDWAGGRAELPIALGKDVSGRPLVSDLAKMPHLLIAGATGSGKSVCINAIIASLLYSKSPKDVRLIMVDPKVVELKIFNALPHMLIPVVTEPKKVPAALKWLLNEMEQRYQMFARENVRNIAGFNSRKKNATPAEAPPPTLEGLGPPPDDALEIPARLPYIVAIVDELADLMMVAPAEIETSIARLAQLARAAGIHLIIATQRPSVNVITGVIKANLPSRIAFQVASQVDSRTILDGKGADTLIGRGDMLFSPPGTSRLVRAQGAFVADEEVQAMVEFLKQNGPPQYAHAVQEQIDSAAAEAELEENGSDADDNADLDDEALLKKALDVLRTTKRASTSMIQRRLRIGYNRAARLVDLMEERGIVGPENGSSPREILKDLDSM
ncbi:MAG: DNA translocase FtsK 4TM domain-containing protein [Verrucomicrobiota bacterium]